MVRSAQSKNLLEKLAMNRRDFVRAAGGVSASVVFANSERLFAESTKVDSWRTFEVTTRVEVMKPSGVTRM
jgi:hypothetical protein